MRKGSSGLSSLAFAASLGISLGLAIHVHAEASPTNDPRSRQTVQRLLTPLPSEAVARFSADLQGLLDRLETLNTGRPDNMRRITRLRRSVGALTPDHMTLLANAFDRAAISMAVKRLNNAMGTAEARRAIAAPEALASSTPPSPSLAGSTPLSPADLVPPPYGICTPPGSDAATEDGLRVAIAATKGAIIPLQLACESVTVILGEDTQLPFCIADSVADFIELALETTKDKNEFCDPFIGGAETNAAWQNTIVIDNDLNNFGNSTTTLLNNLNNAGSNTTTLLNNLGSQITSVELNIDTRLDNLSRQLAGVNADIDTRLAGVDTDVLARATQIDAEIATLQTVTIARATQIDTEIATLQALTLRLQIEANLGQRNAVGLFELPQAQGGQLELVRSIVNDIIQKLLAAGQDVGNAQMKLAQGDTDFAAGDFKKAYGDYAQAYSAAVR
jgi:hypothetical protein